MFGIGRADHAEVTSVLRFLTVAVLICILCGLLLSIASDGLDAKKGDEFTVDGITYEVTQEGGVNEVAVIAADKSLTVYNGVSTVTHGNITYNVTSIGKKAFCEHDALTSVVIPKGIVSIDESAFEGCRSLTTLTISDDAVIFEAYVFKDCTGLKELTLPISLPAMGTLYSDGSGSSFEGCVNIEKVCFTVGSGIGYDYGHYSLGPYGFGVLAQTPFLVLQSLFA